MKESTNTPTLNISYSQDFAIRIIWESLGDYSSVGMPGIKDHFFRVECRIWHPTGSFTYDARRIHIATDRLEKFASQLDSIRSGHGTLADFGDPGDMFLFRLSHRDRRVQAQIKVREFQGPDEKTFLTCGFRVDYDLFVNKLFADCTEFISPLKELEQTT